MVTAALKRAHELCEAAGAESVRDFGVAPGFGWHLLGTARIGADRANSVANADHETHDVPGLFIADGSSLPTGGAVNPANTIQAMALRAADRIWESRRG
jgi:choline dehydrogenase-like flavoprotein